MHSSKNYALTKKRAASHTLRMDDSSHTTSFQNLHSTLDLFSLHDADLALVRELRPALEQKIDSLLEAWLQHLLDGNALQTPSEPMLNPDLRKKVLQRNRQCLLTLGDPIDAAYLDLRTTLGRDAQRIGILDTHCFAGLAFYAAALGELASQTFGAHSEKAARAQLAITRLLFFDAQYITQAVMEGREASLRDAKTTLEDRYQNQSQTLHETIQRAHTAEALASIAGLVSGLAHEMGTPMNVIQGHAELLELSAQSEKDRKRLQTIQTQVGRIAKIIQALLKMAHGEKEVSQPFDLQDVIKTSLEFLDEKFRKRGIRVETEFAIDPAMEGDANRIRQLFLNLFLNAADAIPQGGTLQVALAAHGDQIQVTVTDNGVGIREQDLPHVFDPFFTTKEAGHGHGLGLVVAKEIVEDHAGQMTIESIPSGGTRIQIHLPALISCPESKTKS